MTEEIRDSIIEDVHWLQGRLRDADMAELMAQSADPTAALVHGFFRSHPKCQTVVVDGEPAAMFGVVPGLDPEVGAIWLLGSSKLLKSQLWFLRNCKRELNKIISGYELVHNVVHEDNEVHIRWLRWMGFSFLRHVPPFHEFAKCVAPR